MINKIDIFFWSLLNSILFTIFSLEIIVFKLLSCEYINIIKYILFILIFTSGFINKKYQRYILLLMFLLIILVWLFH